MSTIDVKELDLAMVTPFLTATSEVFKQLFNVDLKQGGITMRRTPKATNEVAVIVGLRGAAHAGVMVLSLQKSTAVNLVGVLYPDTRVDEKDEAFADALGEIANIISGNAMSLFSKAGTQLSITTPSIILGQAFQIHLLDQTTQSTELNSPYGSLEINVAIKRMS